MLVGRSGFSLVASATVETFDDNDGRLSRRQFRVGWKLVGADFNQQDGLPALNSVPISQIGFLNLLPVDVSSVERA